MAEEIPFEPFIKGLEKDKLISILTSPQPTKSLLFHQQTFTGANNQITPTISSGYKILVHSISFSTDFNAKGTIYIKKQGFSNVIFCYCNTSLENYTFNFLQPLELLENENFIGEVSVPAVNMRVWLLYELVKRE